MGANLGKKLDEWLEKAKKLFVRMKTSLAELAEVVARTLSQHGLRARHRMLRAVNTVATSTLESAGLDEILPLALRESIAATGMRAGMICLTEGEGERLVMVCQEGFPGKVVEEMTPILTGEELIGSVLARGRGLTVTGLETCARPGAEKWAKYGYRSFMGTPITCDEKVLGVIALLDKKNRRFSRLDSGTLERIVSIIGVGVEKARRYEEIWNALMGTRRMNRVLWELPRLENFDEELDRLADAVCEASLGLACMITLVDGQGCVVRRGAFGYTRQALSAASRMDALSADVLRTGKCLVLSQPAELKDSLGAEVLEGGLASGVCLPFGAGSRRLGTVWISYETPRTFSPWELEQLERLAERVGAAVEDARSRSALRERVQQYKAMQEHGVRIRSCMDLKQALQTLADSARELLGCEIAAACFSSGKIVEQAISAIPRARVEKGKGASHSEAAAMSALGALLEGGESVGLKELLDRPEDAVFPGESIRRGALLAVPLRDEGNQPAGLLMVGHRTEKGDFSEEDAELLHALSQYGTAAIHNAMGYRRAHACIEEYRALLDDVAVGIAMVNKEQTITTVNKRFEELTGFTKQEIEGKMSLCDLLPEAERESGLVDGKGGNWLLREEHEALLRTKSGGEKTVKLSARAVEDGGSLSLCLTELPQRGRAGPSAAEKEGQELREAVLSVLVGLHEPIAAAGDGLDELFQHPWPGETSQTLEAVSERIRECRRTLEELKVLTESHPITAKAVNVNELITTLVEEKTAELRLDNIGVVLRLEADLPAVRGDEEQLRWVLERLMDNARGAMREAEGVRTLTIRTVRQGKSARIAISDTRPRVPPERLEKLFELPKEVGEGPGGWNVSLAACRAIVQRHGWDIFAESPSEEGMMFVMEVSLPESGAGIGQVEAADALVESPPEKSPEVGVRNVLIISGEHVVIDLLEYYLRSEGHRVETCREARDAYRRLRDRDYDIIFCDLKVAGLSGGELSEWLQARKPEMARRVVFITEGMATAESLTFLREPEKKWLEKPFDLSELRKVIGEVLGEVKE